ncbi:MAG: ANTAR domain-containing protein [Patescibacteria group bacterium]|nr:ANTAR domain-containing protein [Patescibacteria group bacterium]MDE2590994.1 ANTAR domain-containing protein [Patescibacteria group bacterium]
MDKTVTLDSSMAEVINLLSGLVVFNEYDFAQFLKHLIKIIVTIVPADSCLIYFYDQQTKQLNLVGSKKPHVEAIDKIVMREGEGITGWVAQHHKTVALSQKAYLDERFKAFAELPEDKFESFLSVPIINETGVVGVINIQNRQPHEFSKQQIRTIESLVKIISSAFAQTILQRKVNKLQNQLEERKVIERAKGILMKTRGISENDAFAFIRTEAMKHRKSMKEIAEAILLVWQ